MLGKDTYCIENSISLNNDEIRSLSLFYRPLIGAHAFSLYMNMLYRPYFAGNRELSELCMLMNVSIDKLEQTIACLNQYKLLKTLKKEDEENYIFVLLKPLDCLSFIRNNILVRNFVLKCSGQAYQEILMDIRDLPVSHKGYKDVSVKLDSDVLNGWSEEDESYIQKKQDNTTYTINSFFDINGFLAGISDNLFPKRYRTLENLKLIAEMADLYNISKDKMATFMPRVIKSGSDEFDVKLLKSLCMKAVSEFHPIEDGQYNVPCVLFMMNIMNGKEVTEYERKMIFKLANDYNLNPVVINTLIEEHLKKYDNAIIEKILYADASDLHRNNIESHEAAVDRLNNRITNKEKKEYKPDYSISNNEDVDMSNLEKFLSERNK